jgi:hypothetical protein
MTLTGNLQLTTYLQPTSNLTNNLRLVSNLERQPFDKSDRVSGEVKRSPFSPKPKTD